MKHYTQIQVYVIRWRPSQCSVDPVEEIILDKHNDHKHVIGKVLFAKIEIIIIIHVLLIIIIFIVVRVKWSSCCVYLFCKGSLLKHIHVLSPSLILLD